MAADKIKEILKHFPDLEDGWKEMEEKLKAEPAEREMLSLKYRQMLEMEKLKENLPEPEFTKAKRAEPSIPDIVDKHFHEMLGEESVSDDLEKAACNYGDELDNVLIVGIDDDNTVGEYATQAFKAGAQWQKDKLMKQALDGYLSSTITGSEQVVSAYVGYGELGKNGDKVKIVIIKEDLL